MKHLRSTIVFRKLSVALSYILGIGILGCGILGFGCSRAPEDPAWFQSTKSGDLLSEDQLVGKINNTDSLFGLHEMRRKYIILGGKSASVIEALELRRDQLVEEIEPFPAIPGKLDFFEWDIRKIGEKRYRVSCYFVVREKLEYDWNLNIMTKVDEEHADLLPADRQQAGYVNWRIRPPASSWEPGEHQILSRIIELEPVPYYINARMMWWPERLNHAVFTYGWFADTDQPVDLEDKPAPH